MNTFQIRIIEFFSYFQYGRSELVLRKAIIRCFAVLFVLSIVLFFYSEYSSFSENKRQMEQNELTLKEAYQLGLKKAKQWNANATLVDMTSVDDAKKNSNGENGRRSAWNLVFHEPRTNHSLIVGIYKDKIVNFIPISEEVSEDRLIYAQEWKVDSVDLVRKAKEQHQLQPGKDWANGYHFNLVKSEQRLFLAVVGLSKENKFTHIYFDPTTGNFLGSSSSP